MFEDVPDLDDDDNIPQFNFFDSVDPRERQIGIVGRVIKFRILERSNVVNICGW